MIFSSLNVVVLGLMALALLSQVQAWSLGIGSLLFKPRNLVLEKSLGDEETLREAGLFFTEAFWYVCQVLSEHLAFDTETACDSLSHRASKLGNELSPRQLNGLSKEQIAEFRRRYGRRIGITSNSNLSDRRAELIVCRSGKDGPIVGCAGIEIDRISTPNGRSIPAPAPLMSNLAIGKSYRRKGLAEDLVRAVENLARKEWGYEEFYLYVEKRNMPAVRLYRKLGYNNMWEDETARTLIPTTKGGLESIPTTLICMKKSLRSPRGIIERIFQLP